MTKYFAFLAVLLLPFSAVAQEGASRFNTNQPIEITSDTLEVFQLESTAIFMGHVVAVQGDVRLKSDKMTVYYSKAEEGKPSGGEKSAIDRLEVEGNVFLATPEETASGARGNYDVKNRTINLNEKVVLTRAQNVLKGDQLTYNLDTGKSVITSANGQTQSTEGKKQRVRALFVPEKEKKQ